MAVIAASSVPFAVLACECIEPPQRTAFKAAAVVFRGVVTKVDFLLPARNGGLVAPAGPTLVTFRASKAWKGNVTSTMKVFAMAHPAMCDGYAFASDTEYVVYATSLVGGAFDSLRPYAGDDTVYEVDLCPLRIRTDVAHESSLLGRGRQPTSAQHK